MNKVMALMESCFGQHADQSYIQPSSPLGTGPLLRLVNLHSVLRLLLGYLAPWLLTPRNAPVASMDEEDGFEAVEGLYGDVNVAPLVETIQEKKKDQHEEYESMFKQFCRLAAVKLPDHKTDMIGEGGVPLLLSELHTSEELCLYAVNSLGHLSNTKSHRDKLGELDVVAIVAKILQNTSDFESGLAHQCMRTIARLTSKHPENQMRLIAVDGVPLVMASLDSSNNLTKQQAMYCLWNLISSGTLEDSNVNFHDDQLLDNLSCICLGGMGGEVPVMSRALAAGALWTISTRLVDTRLVLLNKGVVPTMLAYLDPSNAIAGAITPYSGRTYLSAFNGLGSLVITEDENVYFRQWKSPNMPEHNDDDIDNDND